MQFELPSSGGAHDARELPLLPGFDAVSRECPGVHPDLYTVQDDTAVATLFDLPGLNSGRVEMCNKGDRRDIHRKSRRGHAKEERAERTAGIIGRRQGRNVNYPQAPVPYKYPHGDSFSKYPGAEEEN